MLVYVFSYLLCISVPTFPCLAVIITGVEIVGGVVYAV
jgi:hypothetical protein